MLSSKIKNLFIPDLNQIFISSSEYFVFCFRYSVSSTEREGPTLFDFLSILTILLYFTSLHHLNTCRILKRKPILVLINKNEKTKFYALNALYSLALIVH